MRVDIYRRPEANDQSSYLAVPEGQPIPQEAINTDWADEARGIELDENGDWADYAIEAPARQIGEKGYAITSVKELDPPAESAAS
jgi:hypothetical protein